MTFSLIGRPILPYTGDIGTGGATIPPNESRAAAAVKN
jgi:hypothetical protein